MSVAIRGFILGLVVGLLLAALIGGGTQFDAFARVMGDGRLLLDARLDESAIGRITNLPVGTLGDATFTKRTWILATTYGFVLHLQPEVTPGPARLVQGLQVSIKLPGQVTATNATRVAAGTAVWETLPPGELLVRTRAIHGGRILVVLITVVAAAALGQVAPGLFGISQRS